MEHKQSNRLALEEPLLKALWQLGWPTGLDFSLMSIACFVDVCIASTLGTESLAAIGIGIQVWMILIVLNIAVSAGSNALISRHYGEGDLETAAKAARQSILLGTVFGIVCMIAGLLFTRQLFHFLGASPVVETLGYQWLFFHYLSRIPNTFTWVTKSIFRSTGDSKTPFGIGVITAGLIIVFDCLLCLGPLHLGLQGLSLSWFLAGIASATMSMYKLKDSPLGAYLSAKVLFTERPSWVWTHRIMRIGVPNCLQHLIWVVCNQVILLVIAKLNDPTSCQAAWGLGAQIEELFATMPLMGLGVAVSSIVGQNLGAKQPERAKQVTKLASFIACSYCSLMACLLVFNAPTIATMMTKGGNTAMYASQYLQAVGLSLPFLALGVILAEAMSGAGYTLWPMILETLALLIVRVPLCFILALTLSLGAMGVWSSVAVSVVFSAIFNLALVLKGTWLTHKV
ncbi:MAG: MATE family efflux transporter [Candidatus Obscuribacterales bacterium]|nr:MATE family efflux transporter [Candidatus Obscuribacterales bacterium]